MWAFACLTVFHPQGITFLALVHEKDAFEEPLCVTYTLTDPVWHSTLVDAVMPQHTPPLGCHSGACRTMPHTKTVISHLGMREPLRYTFNCALYPW
jgi:hypothetical protein